MEKIFEMRNNGDPLYQLHLAQAFALLTSPSDDKMEYLEQLLKDIQKLFESTVKASKTDPQEYKSLYELVIEVIGAGLVVSMFGLAITSHQNGARLCIRGLSMLTNLLEGITHPGHLEEVCFKMAEVGGMVMILETLESGNHFFKSLAIKCVRLMFTRVCIAECMDAESSCQLLTICCMMFQLYPAALDEWRQPQSLLRKELTSKYGGAQPKDVENMLRRWLSEQQQLALEICLAFFQIRTQPISRTLVLEILQHDPKLMLYFLGVAGGPRPPWHLTSENDSLAAKVLLYFLVLPPHIIPGYNNPLGCFTDEDKAEWDAAVSCNRAFFTKLGVITMVIKLQNKVTEEDITELCIKIAKQDNRMEDFEAEQVFALYRSRGVLLMTNLRLLINMTYIEEITPGFLMALLPLSYRACERIPGHPSAFKTAVEQSNAACQTIQLSHEIVELHKAQDQSNSVLTLYIPPIQVLGPILLFRLLHRLSEIGYGIHELQTLKILPPEALVIEGLPTCLVHIHQIVAPRVMGKLIRMSVDRRILKSREIGKAKLLSNRNRDNVLAGVMFTSVVELALAQILWGSHRSQILQPVIQANMKSFWQAKKEVVLCVGNASEAAGRTAQWELAKRFARVTAEFCDTVAQEEADAIGWDVGASQLKNQRRFSKALEQLK